MGCLGLGHVDYTVHVEADLLRVRRPVFVAEAVFVLAVVSCHERVIARADGALVDFECVGRVLDLQMSQDSQRIFLLDVHVFILCGLVLCPECLIPMNPYIFTLLLL